MGGDWRQTVLGEVVELKRGYDLPQARRTPGKIPLVSSSGVSDYVSAPMVQGPGVVTGRYGTIGEVHYLVDDFWPLNTTLYVRDFKGNDPRFISYFLKTIDYYSYSDKAAVPGVNRNHLHMAQVMVPPLPEQRAIAHILGSLDDKIELNRRMNRTLEEIARALFKSWFVDFDPVHANARGEALPGLDPALAALFPAAFEDSPLGPIPAGWRVGTLGDVAGINERSVGRDYQYDEIQYIDISSVSEGNLSNVTLYALDSAPSRARRLVGHGDTIWSTVRPNRKSYLYIQNPADDLVVSTGFAVLTPRAVPSEYLHLWTTTQQFVDYLTNNTSGSAYPAVNADRFAAAQILIPASQVLDRFSAVVAPLFTMRASHDRESRTLAALRDTLLPKLMSGDLRVPAAAGLFEESK